MPAPKGHQPPGGSRKGIPNKATKALKDMILAALDTVGGQDYLAQQAVENPGPFLTLIGKVLPTTIVGGDPKTEHPIQITDRDRAKAVAALIAKQRKET